MNKTPNSHNLNCGRQEDLIAYLYDEASDAERDSFEKHLGECGACSRELKSFQSVRHELSLWQVPFAPRVEIEPTRKRWLTLPAPFMLFPRWLQMTAAGTLATAAILAFLSFLGTSISVSTNGIALAFGKQVPVTTQSQSGAATPQPVTKDMLTRAEAEAMIQAAVTQAQADAQEKTQLQLAGLEQRLDVAHRAQMTKTTTRLHNEYRRLIADMNRQEPSLREWLFASYEEPDTEVKSNGKSN